MNLKFIQIIFVDRAEEFICRVYAEKFGIQKFYPPSLEDARSEDAYLSRIGTSSNASRGRIRFPLVAPSKKTFPAYTQNFLQDSSRIGARSSRGATSTSDNKPYRVQRNVSQTKNCCVPPSCARARVSFFSLPLTTGRALLQVYSRCIRVWDQVPEQQLSRKAPSILHPHEGIPGPLEGDTR